MSRLTSPDCQLNVCAYITVALTRSISGCNQDLTGSQALERRPDAGPSAPWLSHAVRGAAAD
eukprot:6474963-Pyramimonas_sp.AAC.1